MICVKPCKSINNALADLMGNLGILEILKAADIGLVVTDNMALFLSLYHNYSMRCTCSAKAIRKLHITLDEEEGLRWYLDGFYWHWKPRLALAFRSKLYMGFFFPLDLLLT